MNNRYYFPLTNDPNYNAIILLHINPIPSAIKTCIDGSTGVIWLKEGDTTIYPILEPYEEKTQEQAAAIVQGTAWQLLPS